MRENTTPLRSLTRHSGTCVLRLECIAVRIHKSDMTIPLCTEGFPCRKLCSLASLSATSPFHSPHCALWGCFHNPAFHSLLPSCSFTAAQGPAEKIALSLLHSTHIQHHRRPSTLVNAKHGSIRLATPALPALLPFYFFAPLLSLPGSPLPAPEGLQMIIGQMSHLRRETSPLTSISRTKLDC